MIVVLACLLLATLGFVGFGVAYLLDASNQVLGLSLGLAFAALSVAAIVAGKRVVPQEEVEEEAGAPAHPGAEEEAAEIVHGAGRDVTRRRLLLAAVGGSAAAGGAALALPAASLGPLLDTERLTETPWREGRRLVDVHGAPIDADHLEPGSFVTAFAEGVERKRLDASLIVVRLREDEVNLPPERAGWAPEGILAYSKICTHAACAVSEFAYPKWGPTTQRPRLICPCHYSAFDAGGAAEVMAGPAGRPLPQLPLRIEPDRTLVAAGELSGPPGPSWSRVREET